MKTEYFCDYHLSCICKQEEDALSAWHTLMKRGMRAYVDCRLEAADIFLQAALDIALTRLKLCTNNILNEEHVIQPAQHILELHIANCDFNHADSTLNKIQKSETCIHSQNKPQLLNALNTIHAFIEKFKRQAYQAQQNDIASGLCTPQHAMAK